jgi:hypothetical protein
MSIRKFPYSKELNVSGEICSFAQEEETPELSDDWHLQKMVFIVKQIKRMHLIDILPGQNKQQNQ